MKELFSGNLAIREQARTLFSYILTAGPVTRLAILDHLAMPPTTLNRALDRLKSEGLILESGQADSTGGRPASLFSVRSEARLLLGITLAEHQAMVALLDLAQNPVARESFAIDGEPGTEEWLDALEKAIADWTEMVPDARPRLCCAGLDLQNAFLPPVVVDRLKSRLEHRLDCPVSLEKSRLSTETVSRARLENDRLVALLVIGDHLSLDWSEGVPMRDADSNLTRIHAVLMADPLNLEPLDDVPLEDLVTTGAIVRRFSIMREAKSLGFDDFLAAYRLGKKKAVRLAEATADILALLVVNVACMTGVTSFLITGDLFERWPELFDLAIEKIPAKAGLAGVAIQWSKSEHVIQDTAVGTAIQAWERLLSRSARFKQTDS